MDLQDRSPKHSVDRLITEDDQEIPIKMTASGIPDLHDPMPEIGYGDDISEADTHGSYIPGPMGGSSHGNRDHWPNQATPEHPQLDTSIAMKDQGNVSPSRDAGTNLVEAAAGLGAAAALASHKREMAHEHDEQWQRTSDEKKRDTIITNPYEGTSPIALLGGPQDRHLLGEMGYDGLNNDYATGSPGALPKDEGYISSAPNARSPGAITPERGLKSVGFMDDVGMGAAASALAGGDPFYTPKHGRHLSGMSHGMESPIYESATGHGMDRIKSQDIVALMDHVSIHHVEIWSSLMLYSLLFEMLSVALVILRFWLPLFVLLLKCGIRSKI